MLEKLGNASCVPVLLDAAQDADEEVCQAALAVLAVWASHEWGYWQHFLFEAPYQGYLEESRIIRVAPGALAASVAADASALYSRNLLNFLNLLCDPKAGGTMNINREDDIIAGTLLCLDGAVVGK
mgnify:CR=1 FL=1